MRNISVSSNLSTTILTQISTVKFQWISTSLTHLLKNLSVAREFLLIFLIKIMIFLMAKTNHTTKHSEPQKSRPLIMRLKMPKKNLKNFPFQPTSSSKNKNFFPIKSLEFSQICEKSNHMITASSKSLILNDPR